MNLWIVLIALAGAGCALALTYLCLFRNAPLRDDMADDHTYRREVPQQRGPVEMRVFHDSREDGEAPSVLENKMSA